MLFQPLFALGQLFGTDRCQNNAVVFRLLSRGGGVIEVVLKRSAQDKFFASAEVVKAHRHLPVF